MCAVRQGRSVDTSMGFTPLEGVPMSKRSGSVDPGMLLWLLSGSRFSVEELREGLEHRSARSAVLPRTRCPEARRGEAALTDGDRGDGGFCPTRPTSGFRSRASRSWAWARPFAVPPS
ncbi:hypothetical protein [Streptosporangium subroseum]|uniref:hypothetical protein n=1 Tax=Streptosporangium subroseum TaxID=106412 RepID=UPI00352F8563